MIKIRMKRKGRVNAPIYNIVAADHRSPRDGKFLEMLGVYKPQENPVLTGVNVESLKRWVTNGAQMSPTVKSLLKNQGIKLS